MKLIKITGCGDCPHRKHIEKRPKPAGDGTCVCRVLCDLNQLIEGFYRTGYHEGTYELIRNMKIDGFIIPGCPLPDAPETEEKE